MSIPAKWRDTASLQQQVASQLNPVLQGYAFPRYDTAPDNADGLFYYDTTLSLPAWNNGAAWKYFLPQTAAGNVTISGTLGVTSATTLSSTLSVAGNATFSGTLSVAGNTTLSGTLAAGNTTVTGTLSTTGAASLNSISSGSIASTSTIRSSGGGVGYSTGAGGTVTQSTSKSTGVTLNKLSGEITMDAAALAANTTVSFTLTNSQIAASDVLVLNHSSGGTAGSYTLNAQCAAGSASINVRNVTAGSLSQAIVIRFVVIKAVTN